jgi:hypothetical protein
MEKGKTRDFPGPRAIGGVPGAGGRGEKLPTEEKLLWSC